MAFWRKSNAERDALRREYAQSGWNPIKNQDQQINLSDIQGMSELFGIQNSLAGPIVTADTAMRIATVFGCVRLIGSCISSSDLLTRKWASKDQLNSKPDSDHYLYNLLRSNPNPFCTASIFWKFIAQHKLLEGNGYAWINRYYDGRVKYLLPVRPSRVVPYQAWQLGYQKKIKGLDPYRLFYYVTLENGKFMVVDQDDMLHFPNIGWDGRRGMSTISVAAQSMGLALAAEEHGSRFYSQGTQYQYAITYPGKVGEKSADQLKQILRERNAGLANAFTPMILSEGATIHELSMTAEDAELIKCREFSVVDICRWFGVPPIMIGESTKQSSWGAGVEQMARWFVMFTLNDHFTDLEQELERKLFNDNQHFAKFDETKLMRGDTKTRSDYNMAAIGNTQRAAWMTPNEIRAQENLTPDSDPKSDKLFRPPDIAPPAPKSEGNKDEKPANPAS
jgi:HK97 family phage portal protein